MTRPLHFGGDPTFAWAAHREYIDELRISDVALLPGSGSGDRLSISFNFA